MKNHAIIAGTSVEVARGHSNSILVVDSVANVANNTIGIIHNATLSATLDTYIYNVAFEIIDAADFLNIAGEAVIFSLLFNLIPVFNETISFDMGYRTVLIGSDYGIGVNFHFATPLRLTANLPFRIYCRNGSGNNLDIIYSRLSYYLEGG